jgi:hypothetical protein
MLSHLIMSDVKQHYMERCEIHKELVRTLDTDGDSFTNLALGISNPAGNYSAAEHALGIRILKENGSRSILSLARELNNCHSPKKIPEIISAHKLKYLKISVGSEMSMMLSPDKFWVANVRTVWSHLLIKHGDDYKIANEALSLYRDSEGDRSSEMEYKIWSEIHPLLEVSLCRLNDLGNNEAQRQNVKPGQRKYLWADAIANALYASRSTHSV